MIRLRLTLRVIALALVLAMLVVGAAIVLARWQAQLAPPAARDAGDIAMPLSASGTGAQTVDGVQITFRLEPYPVRAGRVSTLTVLALDLNTGQTRAITPTLEVAPLGSTAPARYDFQPGAVGAYAVSGVLFKQAGDWRVRVRSKLLPDDSYVTVMVVQASE